MQIAAKLKNKSVPHSSLLRPRVGDVVSDSGNYYQNTSGRNAALSDTNHWFKIYNASSGGGVSPITINKNASDISGSSPDFSLNLTGTIGLPSFPASIQVFIDLAGDGNFKLIGPPDYNPQTKVLRGMSSGAEYPNQIIKILVL